MVITYAGRSAPSARLIAEQDENIRLNRGSRGDINWGRNFANTELNPDISNVTNKRRMRELFRENSVPTPKLLYPSVYDMNFVNTEFAHGRKIVGRPDTHMKGRGFWLCRNMDDVRKALRGTRRKRAATHFMEYIEAPREYRVHIFLGKSIRISEKDHTAFHEYTTIRPSHNVDHVREAAKQAVKAVGLDFGAVDVLADDDNCWVLEVNSAPGVGGSMPRVYAEKFNQYMRGKYE